MAETHRESAACLLAIEKECACTGCGKLEHGALQPTGIYGSKDPALAAAVSARYQAVVQAADRYKIIPETEKAAKLQAKRVLRDVRAELRRSLQSLPSTSFHRVASDLESTTESQHKKHKPRLGMTIPKVTFRDQSFNNVGRPLISRLPCSECMNELRAIKMAQPSSEAAGEAIAQAMRHLEDRVAAESKRLPNGLSFVVRWNVSDTGAGTVLEAALSAAKKGGLPVDLVVDVTSGPGQQTMLGVAELSFYRAAGLSALTDAASMNWLEVQLREVAERLRAESVETVA